MLAIAKGANMALMFVLELSVLAAVGYWGFTMSSAWALKLLAGIGAPVLFGVLWGLFAAGGGANATYPLTGIARGLFEVAWFGGGVVALHAAGALTPAVVLGAAFVVNAVLRLVWHQS
ncbi:YrdB family protein [Nonomuraea sp. NPDC059194]|uniref:YrdB family protein n=1 Tax=Nonomuraea sp. NPDC059194 TaxID=3346764 RepID=UPI0036C54B7D